MKSSTPFTAPETSAEWAYIFTEACQTGNLAVVKKLCSSEFQSIADIHAWDEQGFLWACREGHLDVIKFLTTSKELIKAGHTFADLHANDELGFRRACGNGHLEVVKFLTTSPDLLETGHTFVDIHANDEDGFLWACENHHWNVIQFLIFELKIERTSAIDMIIKDYPQAQEIFRAREEQEEIQQSLIEAQLMLKNSTPQDQAIKSDTPFRI